MAVDDSHAVVLASGLLTTHPGTAPPPGGAIRLFDLPNGKSTLIAPSTSNPRTGGIAVLDGAAYWDVHPDPATTHGEIRRFDIASGQITTVATGTVSAPEFIGTGISWGSGGVSAELPASVRTAMIGSDGAGGVVSDGSSFALSTRVGIVWADRSGIVRGPNRAACRGHAAVARGCRAVRVLHGVRRADEVQVLDTRTGAGSEFGGIAVANDGVVAFGGAHDQTTATPPIRLIDTTGLPELHC